MVQTTILANARLVLEAETLTGHVVLTDGIITAIGQGKVLPKEAVDCAGDWFSPGLIETSCPNVLWDSVVGMTGTMIASAARNTFSDRVEILGGQSSRITS